MNNDQQLHSNENNMPNSAAIIDQSNYDTVAGGILTRIIKFLRPGHGKISAPIVPASDIGAGLAHERTGLAIERTYLAAERTHMAWIRTALAMIGFGFTIAKLGEVVKEVTFKGLLGRVRTVSMGDLGFLLIVLGTGALLMAALQHWHRVRLLRGMGLHRQLSISFYVSLVLVAIGLLALTSLATAL